MAGICTKFYTGTKNSTPQVILPSKFNFCKSKMAAAAILKFALTAISRSLLHIFAQNLYRCRKYFLSGVQIAIVATIDSYPENISSRKKTFRCVMQAICLGLYQVLSARFGFISLGSLTVLRLLCVCSCIISACMLYYCNTVR